MLSYLAVGYFLGNIQNSSGPYWLILAGLVDKSAQLYRSWLKLDVVFTIRESAQWVHQSSIPEWWESQENKSSSHHYTVFHDKHSSDDMST